MEVLCTLFHVTNRLLTGEDFDLETEQSAVQMQMRLLLLFSILHCHI